MQIDDDNKVKRLTFSRFQVHSVRDDVLQLHQFQLDRICAAESGGRRRSLVVDDDVGGRRRWGGARPIVVAAAAARGWSPCRVLADQLPSAAPEHHHQGPRLVPFCRGPTSEKSIMSRYIYLDLGSLLQIFIANPSLNSLVRFHLLADDLLISWRKMLLQSDEGEDAVE